MSSRKIACAFAVFFAAFHGSALADSGVSSAAATGMVAFFSSFSIIVRESLEAVLVIAAMIAALKAMGQKKSVRLVHMGWIAALAAGFATWYLSMTAIEISGARAETIEGVTSLLAAAVLFYVSYWLISKTEAGKWNKYISSKIKEATGTGGGMAVAAVAFLAVYREAFETVLFYQTLLFQSGSSVGSVVRGLVAGVAVVLLLSFAILKFSVRLPVKQLFSITGIFLYTLSFTLIGKGVHELQEAGIISETAAGFVPSFSVLGIYPTYETFLPQAAVAAAIVFAAAKIYSPKRVKFQLVSNAFRRTN